MNVRGGRKQAERFKFDHFQNSPSRLVAGKDDKGRSDSLKMCGKADGQLTGSENRVEHYEAETRTRASSGIANELELLIEEVKNRYLSSNDFLFLQVGNSNSSEKENKGKITGPLERLSELVRYLGKVKVNQESELEQATNGQLSEYERNIQKLEAKVREHIRIEQQLRLYIEDAKARLQEAEKRLITDDVLVRENHKLKERVAQL